MKLLSTKWLIIAQTSIFVCACTIEKEPISQQISDKADSSFVHQFTKDYIMPTPTTTLIEDPYIIDNLQDGGVEYIIAR